MMSVWQRAEELWTSWVSLFEQPKVVSGVPAQSHQPAASHRGVADHLYSSLDRIVIYIGNSTVENCKTVRNFEYFKKIFCPSTVLNDLSVLAASAGFLFKPADIA